MVTIVVVPPTWSQKEESHMNHYHHWERLAEDRKERSLKHAEHARLVRQALEATRTGRSPARPQLRERFGNMLIDLGFRLNPAARMRG